MTETIQKNRTLLVVSIIILGLLVSVSSCANILGSDDDDNPTTYKNANADVDYRGENAKNQIVFFDFSTGETTAVPHDTWDLAISTSGAKIIANSGDYGTGVKVWKSEATDLATDLSANKDDVKEYTFKDGSQLYGTQSNANPFVGTINDQGMGSESVFLVKDEAGTFYKVRFIAYGPGGTYTIKFVTSLDGTDEKSITGRLDGTYGYTYFDLSAGKAVEVAPPTSEWDVAFARTEDRIRVDYVAGRSDVLINTAGKVEAAVVTDTAIEGVTDISELTFSPKIDALGHGWYKHTHGATPAYSVNTVTYITKTTEGCYAKFQPGTFYGPNEEQFYMRFRYFFQSDGAKLFSK